MSIKYTCCIYIINFPRALISIKYYTFRYIINFLRALISIKYYTFRYIRDLKIVVYGKRLTSDCVRHFVRYKSKLIDREMFYI